MSVVQLLNVKQATPETLLEAMVTSVSQLSGDLSEAQMRSNVLDAGVSEDDFAHIRAEFERNPTLSGETALAWIAALSHDPEASDVLEAAINDADRNAVLLETTAVAVVAMYAMYLLATGGAKTTVRKIERKKDGSYVESEKIVYDSFSSSLKTAFDLFKTQFNLSAKENTEK